MDTEQTETDPQGSSTPTISIIDPVGVSINQLVRVLFRKPVPLRAWFGLGFMLFMIAWTVYSANLASMGEFDTKTFDAGNITISVRYIVVANYAMLLSIHLLTTFHSTRLLNTGPHI